MRLSIGDVLNEAWRLYTRYLGRFVLIGVVVFGLLSLVQFAVVTSNDRAAAVASLVLTVVGTFWLQGALVVAVDDVRKGSPELSTLAIFRRVEPHLWRLVVVGIVASLGIALGLLALVVPGLILMTFWSMLTPAVVLEKKRFGEAFERSWRLVRGDGWRVFAIILISVILATMVQVVIAALFTAAPDSISLYLGNVVAGAIGVPFVALAWTVTYFDLRLNKDHPLTATAE